MYIQDGNKYPTARSGNDDDIITAAESRAKFWQYPLNGPWTVYVMVAKRQVAVHRDANGKTTITR